MVFANKLKKGVVLTAVCLMSFCAFGKSLAFQIVQNDLRGDKVRNSTSNIEASLFDYFFSKGHIVTNSATQIATDSESQEKALKLGFIEAQSGGCQYYITVLVNFDANEESNPNSGIVDNIKNIQWNIKNISTAKDISKGIVERPQKNYRSVDYGVSDMAFILANQINSALLAK